MHNLLTYLQPRELEMSVDENWKETKMKAFDLLDGKIDACF